jgi:putative PIN family toxin of toxin-antitoxin system
VIETTLDTNLLASGFLNINPRSASVLIIEHWRRNDFQLITSAHILEELSRTLALPYFRARISDSEVSDVFGRLRAAATVTDITVEVSKVASHPADDLVLATALSGGAPCVVTGDRAFLHVRSYRGVQIVTPRQLLAILDDQQA